MTSDLLPFLPSTAEANLSLPLFSAIIATVSWIVLLFHVILTMAACGSDSDGDDPQTSDVQGSSESESDLNTTRGRKRPRKVDEWVINVAKRKRNLGQAYVSYKTKKNVQVRAVGNPCHDGCFTKVTQEGVQTIFSEFWALGSYDSQNEYIQKMVEVIPVQRKRTKEEHSRRSCTRVYFVMHNNIKTKVCKQGFMSMHNIGNTRLTTALGKVTSTGTLIADQRGRHTPANRIVGSMALRVREHINLLPALSSYYSRANAPDRKYLESYLTIDKLYVAYMEWLHDQHPGEQKVSLHNYKMFIKELNISFEAPRTDTCTTCDKLDTSIKNAAGDQATVDDLMKRKEEHKQLAQQAQELMKTMATDVNAENRAICVDLQQTLPTPKLSASVACYKRKMWTYNLCIHDLKTNKSIMYVWDESQAKRGSCEVASCIKNWVDEELSKDDFAHLMVFSDNCPGQNKNINLVLYYLRLLHARKLFRIEHVYLIPGHSYMACDRAFGNIERHLRRVPNLYTPDDYVFHIKASLSAGYRVVHMTQAMFLDFSVMKDHITERQAPGSTFKDARKLLIHLNYREGYAIKSDYTNDDNNITQVRLMKRRGAWSREKFNLSTVPLPPLYDTPINLSVEKLIDLKSLLCLMPDDKKAFYQGLQASTVEHNVMPPDEDDVLDYDC